MQVVAHFRGASGGLGQLLTVPAPPSASAASPGGSDTAPHYDQVDLAAAGGGSSDALPPGPGAAYDGAFGGQHALYEGGNRYDSVDRGLPAAAVAVDVSGYEHAPAGQISIAPAATAPQRVLQLVPVDSGVYGDVPTVPAGSPGHPHAPGPGAEFKGGGGSGVVRGHTAAAGIGATMSSRPPAKPKSKATRAGSVCNGFDDMDGEMSI